jgi:hypothetical protein
VLESFTSMPTEKLTRPPSAFSNGLPSVSV